MLRRLNRTDGILFSRRGGGEARLQAAQATDICETGKKP